MTAFGDVDVGGGGDARGRRPTTSPSRSTSTRCSLAIERALERRDAARRGREPAPAAARARRRGPRRASSARARRCRRSTASRARSRRRARRCSSPARAAPASELARAIHALSPRAKAPVRRAELRGAPRDAARERALRPREGRVHRRRQAARRPLRAGRRRHAVPRRDRRAPAVDAGEAAARAAGARRSSASAATRRSRSTCASSPRPTATSPPRCATGRFREDLYYRLNVVHIELPPLRERGSDVLAARRSTSCAQFADENQQARSTASPTARAPSSSRYRWPGNVRELENAIERAVVLCEGDRDRGGRPAVRRRARSTQGRRPHPGRDDGRDRALRDPRDARGDGRLDRRRPPRSSTSACARSSTGCTSTGSPRRRARSLRLAERKRCAPGRSEPPANALARPMDHSPVVHTPSRMPCSDPAGGR